MSGPKLGVFASNANRQSFQLRCRSCAAWGCQARAMQVIDFSTNKLMCYIAMGIPHKHSGVCKLKRGLPPQVIQLIHKIMGLKPRIKLTYGRPPERILACLCACTTAHRGRLARAP